MRKIILYCIMGFMLIIVIVSCITVHSRSAREDELTQGLNEAMNGTIHALFQKKIYSVKNKDEFIADLLQGLMLTLESTSEVTVNILDADEENGLLSVEAVQTYQHINGETGTVSDTRTILFDTQEMEEIEECQIRFYLTKSDMLAEDGQYQNCYKRYVLRSGDFLILPEIPEREGLQADSWKQEDGSIIHATQKAHTDMNVYAYE